MDNRVALVLIPAFLCGLMAADASGPQWVLVAICGLVACIAAASLEPEQEPRP